MSQHIDDLIADRRRALNASKAAWAGMGTWGLALSGGGMRSATFCFGLLRALARDGLLLRFDLLSTVSGGGYVGAMFGRLLQRAAGKRDVLKVVAALARANPRWFVWWLRANGRYLIPRGVKDRLFATALYVRNLIGVHFELGLLGILLGVVLCLWNAAVWWGLAAALDASPEGFDWIRWLPAWLPTPWLLLPVFLFAVFVLACAYWSVPWTGGPRRFAWALGFIATAFALLLWVGREQAWGPTDSSGIELRRTLWAVGLVLSLAWAASAPATRLAMRKARKATPLVAGAAMNLRDAVRHWLTRALATTGKAAAVVVVVGAIDRLAWFLAFERQTWVDAGLALAVSAALLRALLPLLSALPRASSIASSMVPKLGSILGRIVTFLLFAWWVAVVHQAALGAMFDRSAFTTVTASFGAAAVPGVAYQILFANALTTLGWLGLPVLVYLLLSGRNIEFLNLSSLHSFYRSRLVRGYLGAANPARFGQSAPLGATRALPAGFSPLRPLRSVTDLHPDDDLALERLRAAPARRAGAPGQRRASTRRTTRSSSCSTATARPAADGGARWAGCRRGAPTGSRRAARRA